MRERRLASETAKRFAVRTRSLDTNITELSGGNQQKVILGRTFALLSLGYRSHDIARLLGQPIDRIATRIRKLTEQISDHEAAV